MEQRINAMQRVIVIFQKSCHPSSSAVKAIQSAGMKNEQAIWCWGYVPSSFRRIKLVEIIEKQIDFQ